MGENVSAENNRQASSLRRPEDIFYEASGIYLGVAAACASVEFIPESVLVRLGDHPNEAGKVADVFVYYGTATSVVFAGLSAVAGLAASWKARR